MKRIYIAAIVAISMLLGSTAFAGSKSGAAQLDSNFVKVTSRSKAEFPKIKRAREKLARLRAERERRKAAKRAKQGNRGRFAGKGRFKNGPRFPKIKRARDNLARLRAQRAAAKAAKRAKRGGRGGGNNRNQWKQKRKWN